MLFLVGLICVIRVGSTTALSAASALARQGPGQKAAAWRLLWLAGVLLRDPELRKAHIASAALAFAGMRGTAPCRCPAIIRLAWLLLFNTIWRLLAVKTATW